jgi:pimeloyl-ACP methyl ester carboxylesterase
LSDPVAQPRTVPDVVADLHALLHQASISGPYVFAGHSMGGLFVRLYTSTYPEDVAGLVLVDARPDGLFAQLQPQLTPEQWGALMWILLMPPDREAVDRYGLEDYDVSGLDSLVSGAGMGALLSPESHQAQVGSSLLGFGSASAGCPSCRTLDQRFNYGLGVVLSRSWILQNPLFFG